MHIITKKSSLIHVSPCRYFGCPSGRQERDQMAYYWKQIINLDPPPFLLSPSLGLSGKTVIDYLGEKVTLLEWLTE